MPTEQVKVIVSTDDSQSNGSTAQSVKNKAKDVAQSTVATVQDVSSKAKDVAQSTASTVQDTVQSGLTKTQQVFLGGLDLVQELLQRNFKRRNLKKQSSKNLKKAQKKLGNLQDTVQSGLSKTQDTLQTSLSVAQDAWSKNAKTASKNLKKAQKNLSSLQDTVQDNLQSGLGTAQDVLDKSAKSASKSLKKVTKNVKDVQDTVQDRIKSYQRKRARAKFLFRVGLVAGIVLALMYTPLSGSETRQQLREYWQQLSQRAQGLIDRFSA